MKGISLFFVYPLVMLGIGFFAGVESMHFFYPGESEGSVVREESLTDAGMGATTGDVVKAVEEILAAEGVDETNQTSEGNEPWEEEGTSHGAVAEVSASMETLSVDTEYVLEETDIVNGTVVETTWRLPDKYVGLNREQFLAVMENYQAFPPLSEMERGFVSLEVLSFSRERVVVQMNYQYVQPSTSFYLAVCNNEVVVYLEDRETIYINTGIELTDLPEELQQEIIQMMWIADEESLYNFLESYSS